MYCATGVRFSRKLSIFNSKPALFRFQLDSFKIHPMISGRLSLTPVAGRQKEVNLIDVRRKQTFQILRKRGEFVVRLLIRLFMLVRFDHNDLKVHTAVNSEF